MTLERSSMITYQYMIQKIDSISKELPYSFIAFSNFEPTSDEVMIWQKREGFDPYKFGFYNFSISKVKDLFLVKWECRKN